MKIFNKISIIILVVAFIFGFTKSIDVSAATTPSLGTAVTYGILSSTYTNTVTGTTINGDIGFTTGPVVVPAGTHTNYGSGAPYATAGTDQGSALTNLNGQACTFTFANGAIDLATDTTHGPIGVYTPGVYCTGSPGATSIGTAGITLSGAGTYIFRINGALTSVVNSVVTLSGASACDVFWTPTQATTLGANSTFVGTIIDASGITTGTNITWSGRALAFGGTVTTDTNTITVPICDILPTLATLRVIKTVINNNGGTTTASLFNLHVKLSGTDITGSPAIGIVSPGRSYSLSAGTYVVSEDANSSYTQTFSGDCNSSGSVILAAGDNKTCTITNDDILAVVNPATLRVIKTVINNNGGTTTASLFNLHVKLSGTDITGSPAIGIVSPGRSYSLSAGTYVVSEDANSSYTQTFSGDCNSSGSVILAAGDNKTCTITNDDILAVIVPALPNTGFAPEGKSIPWGIIIPIGIFIALSSLYLVRRKQTI